MRSTGGVRAEISFRVLAPGCAVATEVNTPSIGQHRMNDLGTCFEIESPV
jgi:hypothetical protein